MRRRWAGIGIATVTAVVAAAPSPAVASGVCNEGQVNPADVSGIPRDLAKATGLQELNSLNQYLGRLNQLDGRVPLHAICQLVP